MKNYVKEIESGISRFENFQYPVHSLSWLADRINWCYKFKHITEKQKDNFCDRMIRLFELYREI